jgi:F-type H+-transporting ATPase subunit b
MQIVSNIALITINETLIVQLISFLLFLFIINRIMFQPLRQVMAERSLYIETLQQEIVDQQNELQKIAEQIKQSEKKIVREAHHMSLMHEDSGNNEAARIMTTTQEEIAALKEKTAKEVDNQFREVSNQLKNETDVLVSRIIEKILDRKLAS